MRRTAIALTLIMAVLVSSVAGQFVSLATANPYFYGGMVPTPIGAEPPIISVVSPVNNSIIASNNIPLTFSVNESKDTYLLKIACYEVDWKEGNTSVLHLGKADLGGRIVEVSYNENLNGIPEGSHSIHIYASALGSYIVEQTDYIYSISCSSSIYFTVDTTSPSISILSLENKTYTTSDGPLDFFVNEAVSKTSYVLDGLVNVTVNGNTTLPQLAYGEHNVTVYATDLVGNIGASETVPFTIAEPFPATFAIAASSISVATVGIVLFVYFKKRKR